MKVRLLMSRNITCVSPTDSLQQAHEIMQEQEIRHLPVVVEKNRLVGILSDRDILLRADFDNDGMQIPDIDVGTAMTTEVVTCRPSSQMTDIAEIMLEHKIDAIPVTDELGEIIGLITSADFIELASRRRPFNLDEYRTVPFEFTIRKFKPGARKNVFL